MYADVLSVIPSNTFISVLAPANDSITEPLNGNVWDSFVRNVVTASVPSEPPKPGWTPNNVNESFDMAVPFEETENAFTSYVFGVLAVGFSPELSTVNVVEVPLPPWIVPSL